MAVYMPLLKSRLFKRFFAGFLYDKHYSFLYNTFVPHTEAAERRRAMVGYLPWDKSWQIQITYLPWVQPDMPGMEESPVLPAYPVFVDSLKKGLSGEDLFTAIAGAMVFLLGHEPESPVNPKYCDWLRVYNEELARQLFYQGTEMTAKYDLAQAIWMLQASLLLDPGSHETNYNLALAFNHMGAVWLSKDKFREAGECFRLAQQYLNNASQLAATPSFDGVDEDFIGDINQEGNSSGLRR
jgi:hypothetical protein